MILDEPASQDDESAATRVAGMLAHAETIERARRLAEEYATSDPTFAELMGTYIELGERIAIDGEPDRWLDIDCRDLVDRTIALGRVQDEEMAQALATQFARLSVQRRAA